MYLRKRVVERDMRESEITSSPVMETYDFYGKHTGEGDMIILEKKGAAAPIITSSSAGVMLKPFVEGGLVGGMVMSTSVLLKSFGYGFLRFDPTVSPTQMATIQSNYYNYLKRFPTLLFLEVTCLSAQLGSFEVLKRKFEAANNGRPISLFQEAYCGMTAGAIGAIASSPVHLASQRILANANLMAGYQSYSKNLLLDLFHTTRDKGVLALWKGGGYCTAWSMAVSMGMFAPYGRSVGFFKESFGLSDDNAKLSGIIVSGFAASYCTLPCTNTYYIMRVIRDKNKDKYQCTGFLDCALKSVKLGGVKIFYKGYLRQFKLVAPHVMMTMCCLEDIRNYGKQKSE